MSILVGSEVPVALTLVVSRALGSTIDFLTVTSAAIRVLLPKLTTSSSEAPVYENWVPSVVTVTSSVVHLVYPFAAGGGDLPRVGVYRCAVDIVYPGGVVPCLPCQFPVISRF